MFVPGFDGVIAFGVGTAEEEGFSINRTMETERSSEVELGPPPLSWISKVSGSVLSWVVALGPCGGVGDAGVVFAGVLVGGVADSKALQLRCGLLDVEIGEDVAGVLAEVAPVEGVEVAWGGKQGEFISTVDPVGIGDGLAGGLGIWALQAAQACG